jgi:AcrR family transcriptional regulator
MERYSRDVAIAVKARSAGSRREAQVDATRRHVVDVATPLFASLGYEATSVRQVADAAGVSPQTLYNAFGSKSGLFSAVVDVVVAGDHEPVAVADRPAVRVLDEIEDPVELVRAAVAAATDIVVRLEAIFPVLRAAAASDPDVAASYQRYAVDARYDLQRHVAERLGALGALRPGMSTERAADVLWTVLSPDIHHLLGGHRGWAPEAYAAWATDVLLATVVTPRPARRRGNR